MLMKGGLRREKVRSRASLNERALCSTQKSWNTVWIFGFELNDPIQAAI
jgi:hypothetical protein